MKPEADWLAKIVQNTKTAPVPRVRASTVMYVRTVAAWVRFSSALKKRPIAPRAKATARRTTCCRTMSPTVTPPYIRTMAVIGTAARIISTTYASAAASLPTTMAPGRIGVLTSRSRVSFSRSRLICPDVAAGAMKQIRMSWKIERTTKIDCPTMADAFAGWMPTPALGAARR